MANNKQSKADEIFDQLTYGLEMYFAAFQRPKGMLRFGYDDLMDFLNAKEQRLQKQAIGRMETQNRIKAIKRGNKIYYQLTEEGWLQKIRLSIIDASAPILKDSVCIVTFDIPERVRSIRDAIRLLLADAGFEQVHRSVWMGKRDISIPLSEYVKLLKIEDWIRVFIGREVK